MSPACKNPPSHLTDPWAVPVPVAPAGFTALHAIHAGCAVQVDLGRIGPFGFSARPEPETELLYSDLQTNADGNISLRLGSGRAGFYSGKYLKGVGRTPLAANWCHPTDRYHSSGHLLPSAAAREYLVSCYLEELGAGDSLVVCEGLLLAPLPPDAERYVESIFPGLDPCHLAPADRRLQAITVKDAGFARLSNFVWAFSQWRGGAPFMIELFLRMTRYLGGPSQPEVRPGDVTPDALAERLERAIERLVHHFERFFQAGVYWGSFHNNFTADGRFLDLETPVVLGGPFIGLISTSGKLPESVDLAGSRIFVGCEVLHCLQQIRTFLAFVIDRLEWLGRNDGSGGELERRFLWDTAEALRARFPRSHWLHDVRALGEKLTVALTSTLALPREATAELSALVEAQCSVMLNQEPRHTGTIRLVPVKMRIANPEPAFSVTAGVPRFLEGLVGQTRVGRTFNTALGQVDGAEDVTTALQALREAEATIRGSVREQRTGQRPGREPLLTPG
ncbi:hypothetical protein [Vitiosangium sp. GDMCC 1.1324]|uniref:hypothetical protein n=1 Tax=Vitiosangium sp. (strain GDMCC 1.1324) TaxID=2138576 RepID=UPI000D39C74B|nr:hypothetical protein [Vitiosangium sp. GDMCC 1.1324]PTL80933.1 hypothetical protein DAT35_26755 [Vitiosangium sp. GDMCC 1.1324]